MSEKKSLQEEFFQSFVSQISVRICRSISTRQLYVLNEQGTGTIFKIDQFENLKQRQKVSKFTNCQCLLNEYKDIILF